MPLVTGVGQPAADAIGESLAELAAPVPQYFVDDHNAAEGKHFLHHPQAERKAELEPYRLADDPAPEAIPLSAYASRVHRACQKEDGADRGRGSGAIAALYAIEAEIHGKPPEERWDLYGQCADLDGIVAACDHWGVPVLSDSAESLGASGRGGVEAGTGRG